MIVSSDESLNTNHSYLQLHMSLTVIIFIDDSGDCVLEVDSGSFKWKGWKPDKDKNGQESAENKESENDQPNPEYDEIEQPFSLENVNLQIQKVCVLKVVFFLASKDNLKLISIPRITFSNGRIKKNLQWLNGFP